MTASPTGASPEPGEAKPVPAALSSDWGDASPSPRLCDRVRVRPRRMLQRLAALTGQGILTKEEFAAQKAKILAS
jgi:hypothetical protein